MRKIKQATTIIFFGLAMIATMATSKKTDRVPVSNQITNYAVDSSCAGSISQSKIRVNRSKIVEASFPVEFYADGSDTSEGGHRSFEKLGFQYYSLNIGADSIGKFELTGRDCFVKGQEFATNDSYDPDLGNYWFNKAGFFTKTTYECFDHNQYLCTVSFEELPAGEFSEINAAY